MFSFIDEALSAVEGINPNAYIFGGIFSLELHSLGELLNIFLHFELEEFILNALFELGAYGIGEIFLRDNAEGILPVFPVYVGYKEVLDEIIHLCDGVIFAFPAQFRSFGKLMQDGARIADQIQQK
jgi:hypothetical protein